jgi:hypothetical protein
MPSNRLVILTILIVSFAFFVTPVIACYFPSPDGSSILVTVQTTDGTPIHNANVELTVYNGSSNIFSETEQTGDNGQFLFPGPDGQSQIETGLTYELNAVYYGDNLSADCPSGTAHSADYGPFSLNNDTQKTVVITISGVTAANGGSDPTATPCPTNNPGPTVVPITPKGNNSCYPAMPSGWDAGSIVGVILASDGQTPVHGAYVAIVNSTDPSIEYSCMCTDSNGFYQFNNVNSTANAAYEVFAAISPNCTVYSNPIQVESGNTTKVNLVISSGSDSTTTPVSSTPTPTADVSATPTAQPNNSTDNSTAIMSQSTATGTSLAATSTQGTGLLGQIDHFVSTVISGILSI